MLKGLGFKSYVCHLCVIFIVHYFNNVFIGIIVKFELDEWLTIDVTFVWLCVWTLA